MKETMEDFSPKKLFHLLDTDENGKLEKREILSLTEGSSLETVGSLKLEENTSLSLSMWSASNLSLEIRNSLATTKLYNVTILGESEVGFIMASEHYSYLQRQLKGLIMRRPKFVTINDNRNYSAKNYPLVEKAVFNYYKSLLPNKSSFELTDVRPT